MNLDSQINNNKGVVLVVEDNPIDRDLLVTILKKDGYKTIEAKNGNDAIESAEKQTLDAILLDGVMPNLDGYTACKYLKQNDRLKDIPIIFITASDDKKDHFRALKNGANDFISKPVDPYILLLRIKNLVQNKHTTKGLLESEKKLHAANEELEDKNLELEKSIERANLMAVQSEVAYVELDQIFNTSADGMWVIDNEFKVIRVNETLVNLLGINKENVIEKKCYEISDEICNAYRTNSM